MPLISLFFIVWFAGIVVALSIVPCVFLGVKKHLSIQRGERCEGKVVEIRDVGGGEGSTYQIRVEYRDSQGAVHSVSGETSGSTPSRELGDRVFVSHHADGTKADILVFSEIYLIYWLWFCFALFALGCFIAPAIMEAVYR